VVTTARVPHMSHMPHTLAMVVTGTSGKEVTNVVTTARVPHMSHMPHTLAMVVTGTSVVLRSLFSMYYS